MQVPGFDSPSSPTPAIGRGAFFYLASAVAASLLAAGLLDAISAAWGYALFLLTAVCLSACLLWSCMLTLTRWGQTRELVRAIQWTARGTVMFYVWAVAALAGHYTHETLAGRMEWHWIVFGPLVLVALVALERGIYVKLLKSNALTFQRFQRFIERDLAEPQAMRRTLMEDVVLHRTLWNTSALRWWRHTLIFWGFAAMVMVELCAVFLREAVPAFGWTDIWRIPGHPVRSAFDFLYDFTGLMMLLGCVLALYWGWTVRNKPEKKYADRPMVIFLGFVVLSGFLVEGWRLAGAPTPHGAEFSFVGLFFAWALQPLVSGLPQVYKPLWLVHVVASCALIAYIPASRLIHTCATPLGRLMNSQKALLKAKKMGVLAGLWRQPPQAASIPTPPHLPPSTTSS